MKMKTNNPTQAERRWDAAALDELIDEFTVEAAGDDERILAFLQALEKHVSLPCDGFVIGEPVSVERTSEAVTSYSHPSKIPNTRRPTRASPTAGSGRNSSPKAMGSSSTS